MERARVCNIHASTMRPCVHMDTPIVDIALSLCVPMVHGHAARHLPTCLPGERTRGHLPPARAFAMCHMAEGATPQGAPGCSKVTLLLNAHHIFDLFYPHGCHASQVLRLLVLGVLQSKPFPLWERSFPIVAYDGCACGASTCGSSSRCYY